VPLSVCKVYIPLVCLSYWPVSLLVSTVGPTGLCPSERWETVYISDEKRRILTSLCSFDKKVRFKGAQTASLDHPFHCWTSPFCPELPAVSDRFVQKGEI